ncbi:MAG TPA: hypothetical protein VFP22_02040, partial [Candidatus Limnocylindrales bacterium]|nr:hypothetical protein [Candidatus Limnocylindrales bacterium]
MTAKRSGRNGGTRPTRGRRAKDGSTDGPTAGTSWARGRLAVLVAAVVAVVLLAVVAANVVGGPGRQVETGVIVSVQATSLSSVQGFSIRTQDGRTVDFRVGAIENATQFPPGHLAEHKVTLVPVRVTYVQE